MRFGEEFSGLVLPIGCGVFFMPSPTKYKLPKAGPSLAYGILLGYQMSPGGRWSGRYIVADIDCFALKSLDADEHYSNFDIRPHYTNVVKLGKRGIHFPLKRKYDWYNYTVEGRDAVTAEDQDSSDFESEETETEEQQLMRERSESKKVTLGQTQH